MDNPRPVSSDAYAAATLALINHYGWSKTALAVSPNERGHALMEEFSSAVTLQVKETVYLSDFMAMEDGIYWVVLNCLLGLCVIWVFLFCFIVFGCFN